MEVYVLDGLLRRTHVVDKFESLIWTERWREIGDFELDLKSTLENRSHFTVDTKLAINNSMRVMTIETVEDKTTSDGREILKIKGRSLEAILEDRVVKMTMSDLTNEPFWKLIGKPADVARAMFDHICRPPAALDPNDAIPFLMPGTIFPEDTIPEIETLIEWEQRPDLLYNALKKLCGMYDLGFRLVRNFDTSQLYFDIYTGNDRTTRQDILPPVVFSTALDNIQDTTEFATVEKSKNVAYVFSEVGFVVVYGENVDPDVEGFDRRVLVVNATGVDSGDANFENVDTILIQRGDEALRQQRALTLFDGEVNQRSNYIYGVDYEVGDLVEMRNKDGVITYKRVTEQIFVDDANGERSYPTLAIDMFAGENTWLAWTNSNKVWEDCTTEVWAEM